MEVALDCSGEQAKARTDNFGAYRLHVQKNGRCVLTLAYKGQTATAVVASLRDPVSADFDLQLKDGSYRLVRR